MSLQIIKSIDGKDEYVLLPISAYEALRPQIDKLISDEYVEFDLDDYVANPIARVRIKAGITQAELAEKMQVSQAYISKIESQEKVTATLLDKVNTAINQ